MDYYISKTVSGDFNSVMDKVVALLKEEGFAIKTEIDVTETLKTKLGVDFKKYHILGACNPGYAHEALLAEDKVGVLLPCNVTLIEQEPGVIEIAAMDSEKMMSGLGNAKLLDVARKVNEHLALVIEKS